MLRDSVAERAALSLARRQQLTAAFVVLATLMFVWGALAERAIRHTGTHSNPNAGASVHRKTLGVLLVADEHGAGATDQHGTEATTTTGATDQHGAGATDQHGAGGSKPSGETGVPHSESTENRNVLGINLESLWVIVLGAAVSLLLAGLVLRRRDAPIVVAVIVVAVAFVVLEIAEVQHQHSEGRNGLLVLAAIAGVCHLAAAGTALPLLRGDDAAAV